jgi:hypothetical protein
MLEMKSSIENTWKASPIYDQLPDNNDSMKKWASDMTRNFQKRNRISQKYIKKISVTRLKGNTNQTTLRIHLTPLRMAIIKNTKQQMLVRMAVGKGTGNCSLVQ